jgi:cystathionine gamma-lyase
VVDSTFLSPFYCAPLIPCGEALPMADVVLTSLSKYSGGHSDLILGSLTVSPRTVQAKPHLLKGLRFLQNSFGATASPRDCHLMVRSLKTLSVRALKHGLNALQIAAWLDARPEVEDVKYVGLKSSKAFHMVTHLLSANAKRELEYLGWEFPYVVAETKGTPGTLAHTKTLGVPFGGMIGFRLKGASETQTEAFMLRLRLVSLAESLGGVESLIEAPYGMTHAVSGSGSRRADISLCPLLFEKNSASHPTWSDCRWGLRTRATSSRISDRLSRCWLESRGVDETACIARLVHALKLFTGRGRVDDACKHL